MMTIRGGGFERFLSSPTPGTTSDQDENGSSGSSSNEMNRTIDYWNDNNDIGGGPPKYHCLDMDVTSPNVREPPTLHHHQMALCNGCRLSISDRYILRVDPNLQYHAQCLKCFECARILDENQTAFVRNGQTYCRMDYERLFTRRCSHCSMSFTKTDMVMRAGPMHVYHLDCFACAACEKQLQTGEQFQIKNNRLYCQEDCDSGNIPDTSNSVPDYKPNNNNNSSFDDDLWETSTITSIGNDSRAGSPKSPMYPTHHLHSSAASSTGSGGNKKKKDKQTTRMRTVLNEAQLKILKDCYAYNSRPDALIKEKLVEMTGLNARVIRVWFQNKRCKDKKRQIQMNETRINTEREEAMNLIRVNSVGPLLVAPPTSHIDCAMGAGPLEIKQFAQWPANGRASDGGSTSNGSGAQFGNVMMFNSPREIAFPGNNLSTDMAQAPTQPTEGALPTGVAVFPHFSPAHGATTSPSTCIE